MQGEVRTTCVGNAYSEDEIQSQFKIQIKTERTYI